MTHDVATLEGRLADRTTWRPTRCPIGKAMELVGTRSAMLILREAYYGTTRFDDFADRVGITEAVTAARLRELTAAGLLDRVPYREPGQRTRHEYRLTESGRALVPVAVGLFDWGARYLTDRGRADLELRHHECGEPVHAVLRCEAAHDVPLAEVSVRLTR